MRKFTAEEVKRMAAVGNAAYWRVRAPGIPQLQEYDGERRRAWPPVVHAILREAARIEASKRKVKR